MISSEIQHFLNLADESHEVAEKLIDMGHARFSAAQSYYTIFYLAQAMLQSKGLTFSSHSAVVAAYGKEFAKTGVLDPKFYRYIIDAQERRQIGHYGGVLEDLTDEQARESYQWTDEFKQVVEAYLNM